MLTLLEIARTGVTAILLHPLRSLVSLVCLLVVLVPYLTGIGLRQGLEREANASIQFGADLYVSGEQMGRPVPLSLALVPVIQKIEGVTAVIPRIVGPIRLGKEQEPAVVVGLPAASLPSGFRWMHGRLYRDGKANELVVGTELARRLHLRPGSLMPPFYHNNRGEHLSEVVGVFQPEVSLWQSRLILTSFETASAIFAQEGTAGDLLVTCQPGTTKTIRTAIRQQCEAFLAGKPGAEIQCRIVSRSDLAASIPAGLSHQSGLFQLHFLLAFVAATLVVMVSSGIGLPDRRREIGILKATGWQTDEILLRGMTESLLITLTAASLSLLLAFFWLKMLNGLGIAALLLPGVDWTPSFTVPCQLTPLPALLGFLFAWIIVTSGTLSASWRAAIVPPREALQ
jgi:ABC-type lipoprotein release transport system permease subunit